MWFAPIYLLGGLLARTEAAGAAGQLWQLADGAVDPPPSGYFWRQDGGSATKDGAYVHDLEDEGECSALSPSLYALSASRPPLCVAFSQRKLLESSSFRARTARDGQHARATAVCVQM